MTPSGKLPGIACARLLTIGGVIGFAVACSASRSPARRESAPTVALRSGTLKGRLLPNGEAVYQAIPFAKPPVGNLRWREPLPVEAWSGVRNALESGAPCAQSDAGVNKGAAERSAEDCLYLNVWTPNSPDKALKPAMVWIHGGGNTIRSGSDPWLDGEGLAAHGVVVVIINYRLGIFGFFAHPELTRESSHGASGNYALLDQIAALRWVRENISTFRGDPAQVTVFGESAGGNDINLLMTSPLAKGLFQRAISQSGGEGVRGGAEPLSQMEQAGVKVAEKFNPPAGTATVEFLRKKSTGDLLGKGGFGPNIDGWVLPGIPAEVFDAGDQHHVPWMIGHISREFSSASNAEQLRKAIRGAYGDLAPRAQQLYGVNGADISPGDAVYGNAATQWTTDSFFRCPDQVLASWHTAAGQPTYYYQFERVIPGREEGGTFHSSEIIYLFGTLGSGWLMRPGIPNFNQNFFDRPLPAAEAVTYNFQPADRAIADQMQQYWTTFAKSGEPNNGTLPVWPKVDSGSMNYMAFTDKGPVARSGLRTEFCQLYRASLTPRRTSS